MNKINGMHRLFIFIAFLLLAVSSYGQRSNPPLVCKRQVLAALKPLPRLDYQCSDQLNDYDEKILKLPERVAAIRSLTSELTSFDDSAWWSADPVDLSVCDFSGEAITLSPEQRRGFLNGEYVFWLFGNDHVRLVLIPDPCYQAQYGGSNAFLLYRRGGRVSVTQVLNGYFPRADNSVGLAFAKQGSEEIIAVSTGSGGLNPSLTNYYFTIDPSPNRAVPRKLFRGAHGPTNEISSVMLFNSTPATTPLQIIRGRTLSSTFIIYTDKANGNRRPRPHAFTKDPALERQGLSITW